MTRTAVMRLKRADPVLREVIERVGPCRFAARAEGTHFDALVRAILYQQLSGKAAATIHGRLRDLARHAVDGSLPLDRVESLDDDAVIDALVAVKGVGRWTAQMFLMFRLGRPDVLPELDLGVQKGIQLAYGLRALPTPKDVLRIGAPWAPYRSVASWYMWRLLD